MFDGPLVGRSQFAPGARQRDVVVLIPPGSGGVRDYAEILNRHIPGRILAPTRETPLSQYGDGDILLHFSGYGYHTRSIPTWLVERLVCLRARGARIGVYFHELFADMQPPWRSGFWLGPTQRRIVTELANLSSYWLTNCTAAADWLQSHCKQTPHRMLPVYSNVGEPDSRLSQRKQTVVVFGSPATRARTYRSLDASFWRWAMEEGLAIHDIGPPIKSRAYDRLSESQRIHVHGSLPAEKVSERLADARFGLLWYPPAWVAKSGVFAACAAHGVCTILLAPRYQTHDGLVPDRHYATGLGAVIAGRANSAEIGTAAFEWYQAHRVDTHASAFRDLMRVCT